MEKPNLILLVFVYIIINGINNCAWLFSRVIRYIGACTIFILVQPSATFVGFSLKKEGSRTRKKEDENLYENPEKVLRKF